MVQVQKRRIVLASFQMFKILLDLVSRRKITKYLKTFSYNCFSNFARNRPVLAYSLSYQNEEIIRYLIQI